MNKAFFLICMVFMLLIPSLLSAQEYTLYLDFNTAGSSTSRIWVTVDPPLATAEGASSFTYPAGTVVHLSGSSSISSTPECGYYFVFDHFNGDVEADGRTVIMNGDKNVTAIYQKVPKPCVTPIIPPDASRLYVNPASKAPKAGTSFSTSVTLDTPRQNVAAYGITIDYNPEVIKAMDVKAGSRGFLSSYSLNNPSAVVVAGFDVTGKGPDYGIELFIINWTALTPGTSDLVLSVNSLIDNAYNTIAPLRLENGSINVQPPCLIGDSNGDGVVNIIDALVCAQIYVGMLLPYECSPCSDVNYDGKCCDIIDALMIAQAYVGLITL